MSVNLKDVSNPAAFGVEWSAGQNGNRYQLANPRGTTSMIFGVLSDGSAEWRTVAVVDPARFGLNHPPKSAAEFLVIATRYVNS